MQRRLQAFLDQHQVDGVIAGHIPAPLDAMVAAMRMAHGAVHRLVRQNELRLRQRKIVDKLGIEVEGLRIGAGGGAPFTAHLQRQMHHQRTEKRTLHDETGARRGELGEDGLKCGVVCRSAMH